MFGIKYDQVFFFKSIDKVKELLAEQNELVHIHYIDTALMNKVTLVPNRIKIP